MNGGGGVNPQKKRLAETQEKIRDIYDRAGRACSDEKQSHLREFAEEVQIEK